MERPVPHPERRPPRLLLAVLGYAVAVSFILFAMLIARCSPQAQGAFQVPDLTPFVEEDCYVKIVEQYAKIGRNIPQNSPDQNDAARREHAGDQVALTALMLAYSDRERFQAVIDYACEALRVYWPWKWETCRPCEN